MFTPGNTYGKNGRPKGSSRNKVIQDWCKEKGIDGLIKIAAMAFGDDPGFRIQTGTGKIVRTGWSRELQFEALKLCLAYGLGKPTEHIDVTSDGETLADWASQHFSRRNGDGVSADSGLREIPSENFK